MQKETKGWRGRRELQTHNYDRTSRSTPKIAPKNILSVDLCRTWPGISALGSISLESFLIDWLTAGNCVLIAHISVL